MSKDSTSISSKIDIDRIRDYKDLQVNPEDVEWLWTDDYYDFSLSGMVLVSKFNDTRVLNNPQYFYAMLLDDSYNDLDNHRDIIYGLFELTQLELIAEFEDHNNFNFYATNGYWCNGCKCHAQGDTNRNILSAERDYYYSHLKIDNCLKTDTSKLVAWFKI